MRRLKVAEGIWEAFTNSDLTEGRGAAVTIGYFSNQGDALRAAKGRGPMGTDGWVRKVDIDYLIFESWMEYQISKDKELRERALSKLTREEQLALGVLLP